MASLLDLCCLPQPRTPPRPTRTSLIEKPPLPVQPPTASNVVNIERILSLLATAEKPGQELKSSLDSVVSINSWTSDLAEAILHGIEDLLTRDPDQLGTAMRRAYDDAMHAGEEFFAALWRDHKAEIVGVVVTLLAVGVLVALAPWAVEVLGFGELGPIEGSFATWWQARYAGHVPKGSLFSYLQRLGMTWGK